MAWDSDYTNPLDREDLSEEEREYVNQLVMDEIEEEMRLRLEPNVAGCW